MALHRLGWEAMHDGTRFLGDHEHLSVAITRVVADAEDVECPRPLPAPARVLFAVGSSVGDPRIRPGAEVLGLLRGIERRGSSIDSKIVDAVTLTGLGDACERFQPHVVHLIGHGRLRDGRGEVQLAAEEEDDSGWVDGEKLLRAIVRGDSRPAVVLLTGCDSAAAGDHVESLAAEMVKGGIPIAIGMAGKVSDPVCRLFTRGFGISLNQGEQLVEAMTHARRAGLQKQQSAAADDLAWTLPSIYLAPCVPSDHAPVEVRAGSGVLERIANYKIRREPVFCGRQELGRQFERLLDQDDELRVLVAYAEGKERLGKTRLQHEFAGRALRAGHVVVMVDDDVGEPSRLPQTPLQLAAALLEQIVKTRERFGLQKLFDSVLLDELSRAIGRGPELEAAKPQAMLAELNRFLGECRRATQTNDDALADALGSALVADLQRLMADVHGLEDDSIGPQSGVVLILGGVGYWGRAADLLFDRLIGDRGIDSQEMPVPVFATCSFAEDARATLEAARDRSNGRYWERWMELEPFPEGEDVLTYQWVLLHPWSAHPWGDRVYAPNPEKGDGWQDQFRKNFEGIPGDLDDHRFYLIANVLEGSGLLVGGEDDEILEEYARPR